MPVLPTTIDHSNADQDEEASDFETAMRAAGFGLFNILLILVAMPGLFATIFEIATISYVLPAAECDLQLTIYLKGALNSMAFAGTLISAVFWGFISDTFGRKKILVPGLLLSGILTFFSSMSQTANQLMTFKFFGGFVASGPVAVFLAYLSEYHGKKHRPYVIVAIGLINSLPLLILPVLAYFILPKDIHFDVGSLHYVSWKVFIAVTSIPALVSGSLLIFFPESPKYLMSQGKTDEALKTFQTIYALNKRKSRSSYPIKYLFNEAPEKSQRRSLRNNGPRPSIFIFHEDLKEGFAQIRPLCSKPYVKVALIANGMFFCLLLSVNAIRLWVPQYFATSTEMEHNAALSLDTCSILEYSTNKSQLLKHPNKNETQNCELHIEPDSYINNIIVATCVIMTYLLTVVIVRYISNSILLKAYLIIAATSLFVIYWSLTPTLFLVLSCLFVSFGVVSMTLVMNLSINAFPTTMRTMAVITILSWGRLGAMFGNLILPYLLPTNCITIFAVYSVFVICTFILSFFVQNTTKQNLK